MPIVTQWVSANNTPDPKIILHQLEFGVATPGKKPPPPKILPSLPPIPEEEQQQVMEQEVQQEETLNTQEPPAKKTKVKKNPTTTVYEHLMSKIHKLKRNIEEEEDLDDIFQPEVKKKKTSKPTHTKIRTPKNLPPWTPEQEAKVNAVNDGVIAESRKYTEQQELELETFAVVQSLEALNNDFIYPQKRVVFSLVVPYYSLSNQSKAHKCNINQWPVLQNP